MTTPAEVVVAHAAAWKAFDALLVAQTALVALNESLGRMSVRDLLSDPDWNAVAALDGLRDDLTADAAALNPTIGRLLRIRRLTLPHDEEPHDEEPPDD